MHAILVVAHGETCHHKRAVPGCLGLATTRHSLYLSYLGLSLSKAGAPLHLTALRLQAKAACLWHTILIKTLTHSLIQGYIIFLALHRHPSTTAASCMQNRLLLCKHTPRSRKAHVQHNCFAAASELHLAGRAVEQDVAPVEVHDAVLQRALPAVLRARDLFKLRHDHVVIPACDIACCQSNPARTCLKTCCLLKRLHLSLQDCFSSPLCHIIAQCSALGWPESPPPSGEY